VKGASLKLPHNASTWNGPCAVIAIALPRVVASFCNGGLEAAFPKAGILHWTQRFLMGDKKKNRIKLGIFVFTLCLSP
jgi:hypothetical protein